MQSAAMAGWINAIEAMADNPALESFTVPSDSVFARRVDITAFANTLGESIRHRQLRARESANGKFPQRKGFDANAAIPLRNHFLRR